MTSFWKRITPLFLLLLGLAFTEGGITTDYADAASKVGGKSFSARPSTPPPNKAPNSSSATATPAGGGFGRGLMGGLLGGAIGSMLFGSMFGGSGMGILPLLLLGGVAFFLYRKLAHARQGTGNWHPSQNAGQTVQSSNGFARGAATALQPQPPTIIGENLTADGISQIQQYDRGFDPVHFIEVATDVFFQVQAGWMRRDIDSYRHLLGDQLADEYAQHFAEMRAKGHINKLESMAVRKVEITQAGSDGTEDFVTIQFTANLLDYTVNDQTGELISGNMTEPVKFQQEWTWARPTGTQNWKLEGLKED